MSKESKAKKPKIKSISVYKSVPFGNREVSSFLAWNIMSNSKRVSLELSEILEGVEVKSLRGEQEHLLVPMSNIASIVLYSESDHEKEKASATRASTQDGIAASAISRPR